jgi:hypothetical protein
MQQKEKLLLKGGIKERFAGMLLKYYRSTTSATQPKEGEYTSKLQDVCYLYEIEKNTQQ